MGKTGTVKVEVPSVSLKSVVPVVPKNEQEKQQLEDDLKRMRCHGLFLQPWSLKSEVMVQEFLQIRCNEWEGTIRREPEQWIVEFQAEVYNFQKEGKTLASRTNKYIDSKFSTSINPKDGHVVSDCVDPRKKRVLEFVIPILYPKKPNRITKIVGNTIFGALSRVWKVSWGQVIQEVVGQLVFNLEKEKPSPISPYLFHLYFGNEFLRKEEMQQLEIAKHCLEYGVGPEAEMQPNVVETESERQSLTSAEQWKILEGSPSCRRKYTYKSLMGSHQSKIQIRRRCLPSTSRMIPSDGSEKK